MPDEPPTSKQEIASGDGSQNNQAARDLHVQNHTTHVYPEAKPSPIVRPSGSQILQFDPNARKIIDTARELERDRARAQENQPPRKQPVFSYILVFVIVTWGVFYVYEQIINEQNYNKEYFFQGPTKRIIH